MINVNQITSDLARMPDAALKQYAMMHKSDPYTLSLAMSESNRRQQMRQGAQGQGGQQPTVVDQEIAQMGRQPQEQAPQMPSMPQGQAQAMPADVGIGAFPQPHLQNMAEGGIVAFAEGERVTDPYAGQVENDRRVLSRLWESAKTGGRDLGMAAADFASMPLRSMANKYDSMLVRPMRAAGADIGYVSGMLTPEGVDPSSMTPFSDVTRQQDPVYPNRAAARADDDSWSSGVPVGLPALANTPAPKIDPRVAVGNKLPRPAPARPAGASAPAAPELGYAARLKNALGRNPEEDRFATEREGVSTTARLGAEAGLAGLKTTHAAEAASMFKGREERLAKYETELTKSKDTNIALALIKGGLTLAGTSGHFGSAFVKGALAGTEAGIEGIAKIKASQAKLDEARDRMEDLRFDRSSMNAREVRAEEKGIRDLATQAQRDLLAGREKAYGFTRDDTRAAVASDLEAVKTDKVLANQIKVANITAAPGLARNKIIQASQDSQAKIRTAYGALQTKVMADLAKDVKYQMATPAEQATMGSTALRNALMNNPFLSQYAAGVGFNSAGAGVTRTLDGAEED